ncbi:MAG: sulfotransferase [Phycisphaerales bacterium]|nr:MAG: sulfotransferase [Phycisphaerales bacterium]
MKPATRLPPEVGLRSTLRADRLTYRPKRRPLTARRLWRTLVPNLRSPIFLIGAPRSGTTFLGECISVLPEVSYHFEPLMTKAAVRHIHADEWPLAAGQALFRRVYRWLMRIHLDADLRFAEKTPRNSLIVSFLREAFPDAQFIHIIRDGRDVALSLSRKPWLRASTGESETRTGGTDDHGHHAHFWVEKARAAEFETTTDIHRCAWAWRHFTEAALAQSAGLPAGQYHELRYESLVDQPQQEADRLLDFLGINDPASRRVFCEAAAGARATSVGGWRRSLSPAQVKQIEDEAGPLLCTLGYPCPGIPDQDPCPAKTPPDQAL